VLRGEKYYKNFSIAIIQFINLSSYDKSQNPPPKKRYGYFGRWKGYFLKKSRKNPVITVAL
jgi:hypothetical protein